MGRRLVAGIVLIGLLSGCAAVAPLSLAVDAITGGVGIFQRYKDRQEQQDQTAAIRELKAAVEASTAEMVRLRALMERAQPPRPE